MADFEKTNIFNQFNFDDLYNTFLGLEKPQQILFSTISIVVLVVLLSLPVGCVSSKLSTKKAEYLKQAETASELYSIRDDYAKLRQDFENAKEMFQDKGGDPLKGIIYEITDELGVERHRVTLKTESPVAGDLFTEIVKEVKVMNLRFDQAVLLLDKLVHYKGLPIRLKKLTMTVTPTNRQILRSVVFTASTIQPTNQ